VYVLLLGGSGCTLGLNLLYAFRAKSQRFKLLGRMALPAAICSINEPLQFGTPMILNPLMLLPMVFIPALNSILAFAVTAIGIVPHCNGMMLALGIPVVISGFLEGSWRIAALQVVLVFLDTIIYFPFFAIADKQAKAEETAGTTAEANA
jgi:PTS system cellobiose-specific IIC component